MNSTPLERPSEDAMTIDEVAAKYRVNRNTVLRRIHDGTLKPMNSVTDPFSKRVRIYWISRQEVERLVQQAS